MNQHPSDRGDDRTADPKPDHPAASPQPNNRAERRGNFIHPRPGGGYGPRARRQPR